VTSGAQTAVVLYTGLEPVSDNLSAADRTFVFNGGAETVTLTDHATATLMTIDSTLGESVTFPNPSGSLTIRTGSGDDTLNISSVDSAYRAPLVITGDEGTDTVNVSAALTLGSGATTGSLSITSESIGLNANVNTDAGTNAGSVTLSGSVVLGASVAVDTDGGGTDGNVSISGTVNADAASNDRTLTVTAGSGTVSFSGAVGSSQAVESLTVTSASSLSLGAVTTRDSGITLTASAITLSGDLKTDAQAAAGVVSISGPVILGGNVSIDTNATTTDAAMTFNAGSSINAQTVGSQSLTLDAGTANITLQGVGTTTPLGTVRAVSAGTINLNGNIVTRDSATIDLGGGSLQLNTNVTLDTTGGGVNPAGADVILAAVNASSAADNRDLSITAGTAGKARLTGTLGTTQRLDGLSVTAGGGIELGGNITAGNNGDAVTLHSPVTLKQSLSIDSGNGTADGAVVFQQSVSGPFDLVIDANSDSVSFNGAVGSGTALGDGTGAALTITEADGGVTFNGPVTLANGLSSPDQGTSLTFREDVTVQSNQTATSVAGNVTLDGLTLTSAGGVTLGDATTDVVNLAGTQVSINTSAAGASVVVNGAVRSTVDNTTALSISAGTGDVSFEGAIGDLAANSLRSLTVSGRNITVFQIGVAASTAAADTGVSGTTSLSASGTMTFDGTTYTSDAATYAASSFSAASGLPTTFSTSGDALTFSGGTLSLGNGVDLVLQTAGGAITAQALRGTSSEDVTIHAGTGTVSVGAIGSGNEINTLSITGSAITVSGNLITDNTAGNTVT
jgi:hypothetical protein